jgi:hypothetical protein
VTIRVVCHGTRVGKLIVPSFELTDVDYAAVAIPTVENKDKYELMQTLGGIRADSGFQVEAKAFVVFPLGFEHAQDRLRGNTVVEYALVRGVSRASADAAIMDLRLRPDQRYGDLQLTPRLLLDLRIAWDCGAELVVFSASGLDPAGFGKVSTAVTGMLGRCTAINVFSVSLIDKPRRQTGFNKIIRCQLSQT